MLSICKMRKPGISAKNRIHVKYTTWERYMLYMLYILYNTASKFK